MNDTLQLIQDLGGRYECPKNDDHFAGALVGLESCYDVKPGSLNVARYVTPTFYCISHIEQHNARNFSKVIAPLVAERVRRAFSNGEHRLNLENVYMLSVPAGGAMLGSIIAGLLDCQYAAAEKRFFPEPRNGLKYEIVFDHHHIEPGAHVILVDDVCNTFSVIIGLLKSLIKLQLKPLAIACCVNRSSQTHFQAPNFAGIPIIPLVHKPAVQFRQDDPTVRHLVEEGKVVWDPRQKWPRLLEIMNDQLLHLAIPRW